MSHNTLELSALIGSRICHDLISPIGAIGNGLELLQMGMPPSSEMSLIAESVENANARVRFFRVAFGRATADQRVNINEVDAILRDISKGGRFAMHFSCDTAPDRQGLRAAFLAAMCVESVLPFGGEIALTVKDGTWVVSGIGRRAQIDETLWSDLNNLTAGSVDLSAGQVQFALLPGLLAEMGRPAEATYTDTSATIRF
ncbi:histidine phosphotransferase family protein [Thalassovita sp.]|uniref:histidine phosphotransferase family protein n=1 Tax=Thalassovita sp. TaxID=1979401 RepID=UPI0028821005|nr:histidine phosphotransferase family protein [Thalassovita sp.]MDF1801456.1 histidine phosphotransferase family protein [Thalassovita sp.]